MNPTLQLRTQTLTHYDKAGEAVYSAPVVLAESINYKELKQKEAEYKLQAESEGKLETALFWITPAPRKVNTK